MRPRGAGGLSLATVCAALSGTDRSSSLGVVGHDVCHEVEVDPTSDMGLRPAALCLPLRVHLCAKLFAFLRLRLWASTRWLMDRRTTLSRKCVPCRRPE